jgi:hypothetical protein
MKAGAANSATAYRFMKDVATYGLLPIVKLRTPSGAHIDDAALTDTARIVFATWQAAKRIVRLSNLRQGTSRKPPPLADPYPAWLVIYRRLDRLHRGEAVEHWRLRLEKVVRRLQHVRRPS